VIAVEAARIIAAGKACAALAMQRRRAVMVAGCMLLALSALILFQMSPAPSVLSGLPETVAVPADRLAARGAVDAAVTGPVPDGAADAIAYIERVADEGPGEPPLAPEESDVPAVVVDYQALDALAKTHDVRGALTRAVTIRREIECLALNIYFEARGEPDIGKLAVAHVVMNRVADPRFPDGVCEVIRQGGEWPRHRCQFSWWCDGKSDRPNDLVAWQHSKMLARLVYWGDTADPTRGALWYHADYVAPAWGQVLERAVKIGRHIFYQERRAPGVQLASAYESVAQ